MSLSLDQTRREMLKRHKDEIKVLSILEEMVLAGATKEELVAVAQPLLQPVYDDHGELEIFVLARDNTERSDGRGGG